LNSEMDGKGWDAKVRKVKLLEMKKRRKAEREKEWMKRDEEMRKEMERERVDEHSSSARTFREQDGQLSVQKQSASRPTSKSCDQSAP
jgi:single-stranded DNA-specific DHH superfamily exonuclease